MTADRYNDGDYVFANGNWRLVRQITPIDVATGAANSTIVTASSNALLKVRILTLDLQVGNIATTVNVNSKVGAAAATSISPTWEFGANGGIVKIGPSPGAGCLPDAAAGGNVTIVTSGSAASTHVSGSYVYC